MITLTIRCYRCGKTVSEDMTNQTLSNDLIGKFGFTYAHTGKSNVTICNECAYKLKELQDRLDQHVRKETCTFFDDCEGKGNEKRNINGATHGRSPKNHR